MWSHPLATDEFHIVLSESGVEPVRSDPCCSTADRKEFDVLFADARTLDPNNLPDIPIVVFDSHDYAGLLDTDFGKARTLATRDQVRLILKPSTYRDPDYYNRPTLAQTVGYALAAPNRIATPVPFRLKENETAKVRPFNPYPWSNTIQYGIMQQFTRDQILKAAKPIDISFIGTGASYAYQEICDHRLSAVQALRELPPEIITLTGVSGNKQHARLKSWGSDFPNTTHHFALASASKMMLSPWGYSEISTRDFEAALAGCVLVKPHINLIDTFPDIYTPNLHFGNCRPDWSDLSTVVHQVLTDWETYRIRSNALAEEFHTLLSTPKPLATKLIEYLTQAVQ